MAASSQPGLTVAVTGPTGEIGVPFVRALERSRGIGRILGMARRPFDPGAHGFKRTEYRRGDVLDRGSVEGLVAEADVVVHLAFIIMGSADESHAINLEGSRNVFEAAIGAGVQRLVYASSVAAYGFHGDSPERITEDVPPRGTEAFYYSAQKAEVEGLLSDLLAGSSTDAYVFRPCIVAGPNGLLLVRNIPYVQIAGKLPGAVRRLFDVLPILKPVIPDPGVPFQLVHHDDVATAMRAAVLGRGEPGVYNLAAGDVLHMKDLAAALGWYSIPVPELGVDAAAELADRLPFLPPEAAWLNAFRAPVIMDTSKARRQLGWRPRHSSRDTLAEMVATAREELPGLA
ncbi:MAG: NAD-dependent epimerase/dehydratase family protein [Solirubrobacteraceae bacterium]